MSLLKIIDEDTRYSMKLAQELSEILVCPRCKGEIRAMDDEPCLVCRACRLKYPIVDGIPIMLVDEAVHLDKKL
jgi:uncharacterized protein